VTTQLYIGRSGLQVVSSKRVVEVVLDAVFNQDSSAFMGLSLRMIGIIKHIPSDLEIVRRARMTRYYNACKTYVFIYRGSAE